MIQKQSELPVPAIEKLMTKKPVVGSNKYAHHTRNVILSCHRINQKPKLC